MSREIPEPVRAAAGLAATVLDEVRKLPETLPGLPVRAIGLAMQAALKFQQEYAGLVARGDELFTGIRGEREPGLATFDDEDGSPPAASAPAGFRDSAFDRAEAPAADATTSADEGTEQVEKALEDLEDMALEDVAIEELVDAPPATDVPAGLDAGSDADADAIENALLESDGDAITAVPADAATATDEGGTPVAAVIDDAAATDAAATDAAATDAAPALPDAVPATPAPSSEPVAGYDGFSIAQLRGRLRGYALSTVEELLAYEQANLAREPYLRMLRNRLERLTAEAVEASPLAPRGA